MPAHGRSYLPALNLTLLRIYGDIQPEWKVKVHKHEWESTLDSEVMRPNLMYLVKGKVKQYVSWQPESTEFQLRR